MKAASPGALVQIDTLTIQIAPDESLNHFTAYDPVARMTVAEVRHSATAAAAARFLDKVIARPPFAISGVQVDGGSEFMAGFEQACAEKGLALSVLAPPNPRNSMAPSSGATAPGGANSTPSTISPADLLRSTRSSTRSPTSTTPSEPPGALAGKTPAQYLATLQAKQT